MSIPVKILAWCIYESNDLHLCIDNKYFRVFCVQRNTTFTFFVDGALTIKNTSSRN